MWLASAIAGSCALAQAAWITSLLLASRRPAPAEPPARPPRPVDRSPHQLLVALLFALAAVAACTAAAYADATERQYRFAWALALPGTGILTGIALALTMLASPKPSRRPGAEIFLFTFFLAAFGFGACCGVAIMS